MPTASSTAAPTDRQLRFFNTLAAERNIPQIEAFAPGTTRRQASEAIDGMIALPHVNAATSTARSRDGEQVPTPSPEGRAGRMLLAGGIEATVTFTDGRHCTVEVRTRGRRGNGWTNMAPGEEGARTNIKILGAKVGWVNLVNGEWILTLHTRREEYRTAVLAMFEYAATGDCAGGERVQEASRCGRCFRSLTDPVSIDRGIGPECFGRDTGSQHIAAERDRQAPRAPRLDHAERQRRATAVRDAAAESARVLREEREHDAEFARHEAAQERAAYVAEMREEQERGIGWEPSIARRPARRPRPVEADLNVLADALMTPAPAPAEPTLEEFTARLASRPTADEVRRARDIIAEALDLADTSDADSRLALRVFDAMKG